MESININLTATGQFNVSYFNVYVVYCRKRGQKRAEKLMLYLDKKEAEDAAAFGNEKLKGLYFVLPELVFVTK